MDAGTSGGVWGIERGYCLMVGGERHVYDRLEPIFKTLAPGMGDIGRTPSRPAGKGTAEEGYLYCGNIGAGHFVKMIHNGIEYGLMQAYGEGFDVLQERKLEGPCAEISHTTLDIPEIAEVWRRGSVVASWLLDLSASALQEDPELSQYTGFVHDSGEGRWTIMAALEEAVPVDVLSTSLYARFRSRQEHTFSDKMLSAMRNKFGGHVERPTGGLMPGTLEHEHGAALDQAEISEDRGRPADSCIMVIFGAAGDLTTRKLIPRSYNLGKSDHLPRRFRHRGFRRGRTHAG